MAGLQVDDAAIAAYAEAERNNYISEKKFHDSSDQVISSAASQELDGIHDGLEFPTDEERDTLPRVADRVPWNAYREQPSITSIAFVIHLSSSHCIRGTC